MRMDGFAPTKFSQPLSPKRSGSSPAIAIRQLGAAPFDPSSTTTKHLRRVAWSFSLLVVAAWIVLRSWRNWPGSASPPNLGESGVIGDNAIDHPLHRSETFAWENIAPTPYLAYHPCFDGLQCARLEVPLDWNRTDGEGHRVAIALTKLPAKVPVTDPRYGGPVLINPGGPGGSGVYLVLREGKLIQRIIDSQASVSSSDTSSSPDGGAKYFDVIGFDPRGVNNTTPVFSCFPDAFSRQVWGLESHAEGLLGSSENSFANLWARSQALSHGCSRMAASGEGAETELSQFMNTSPVARDMLEMIERHGEWRALEAKALVTGHAPWFRDDTSRKIPSYDRDSVLERTKWRKGQEKLLYMGFSYGTILGATFAAMYPDRIGRAVIDGVGDADDYYRGGWLTNLNDSDLILDQFCKYCHEAGPGRCALYTGKSSDDIKSFFESIVASMKGNPLAVEASRTRGADIITFTDVKALIKDALYKPLDRFSMMAELLADISRGNGTPFADHKSTQRTISCSTPEVGGEGKVYPETCGIPQDARFEVPAAILCSDGESLAGMTPESYKGYWQILQNQSSLIGDSWAHIKMPCTGWTIRPKWRFNGPISGNTSHPLLIIGNTFDPVTPLGNAHKAAQSFNGSVVLQQDSEGHCSIGAPSVCTAKHVRRYFQTGELPRPGTICDVDEKPFLGPTSNESKVISQEDRDLMDTVREMVRTWPM